MYEVFLHEENLSHHDDGVEERRSPALDDPELSALRAGLRRAHDQGDEGGRAGSGDGAHVQSAAAAAAAAALLERVADSLEVDLKIGRWMVLDFGGRVDGRHRRSARAWWVDLCVCFVRVCSRDREQGRVISTDEVQQQQ